MVFFLFHTFLHYQFSVEVIIDFIIRKKKLVTKQKNKRSLENDSLTQYMVSAKKVKSLYIPKLTELVPKGSSNISSVNPTNATAIPSVISWHPCQAAYP